MDEQLMETAVIAAEVDEQPEGFAQISAQLEALDARVRELETAVADMRTVKASAAAAGRKTVAVVASAKEDAGRGAVLDASLASLSVEQRILVKGGLMRAGLL